MPSTQYPLILKQDLSRLHEILEPERRPPDWDPMTALISWVIVRDPLTADGSELGAADASMHWTQETVYGVEAYSEDQKQQKRNIWKTEVPGTIYIANKGFNLGTDGQPIRVKVLPSLEEAEYSKAVSQVLCRDVKTLNISLLH